LNEKLFGIGLGNALSLFIFFLLLKIGIKVLVTQKPVNGLTEVIHAA
jgi:hypothetical protein